MAAAELLRGSHGGSIFIGGTASELRDSSRRYSVNGPVIEAKWTVMYSLSVGLRSAKTVGTLIN